MKNDKQQSSATAEIFWFLDIEICGRTVKNKHKNGMFMYRYDKF